MKQFTAHYNAIDAVYSGLNQKEKKADITELMKKLQGLVGDSIKIFSDPDKKDIPIDLSSLDPRFSELINILDPNSTAQGNVSLDVSYKDGKVQTYQVVKSEAIREENRRLYESEEDPELKKQYLDMKLSK